MSADQQTLTAQIQSTINQFVQDAALDSYLVFVQDGTILTRSEKLENVSVEETRNLVKLFDDEQDAFTNGIAFNSKIYEVHRWFDKNEPALIYGRTTIASQDSLDSEGCAICRTKALTSNVNVYIVVVYKMPTLAAKAVSKLVDYSKKVVEPL